MNKKESRQALLVVGMHRSGTSAVTRVLNLLGADLPKTLLAAQSDNPTGYWESSELPDLHDAMLASAGLSWDKIFPAPDGWLESEEARELEEKILAFLERNFSDSRLFVIKDPRLTLLIPIWLRALGRFGAEPRFVIPHRPPEEVAASLRARNGFAQNQSFLLWLRYMLDAERYTRGRPRCFPAYEDILKDWRAAAAAMGNALGITWPRDDASAEIDAFLDPSLRHHAAPKRRPDAPAAFGWVQAAHQWFLAASADPILDPAPLDAVRENFGLLEQLTLSVSSPPTPGMEEDAPGGQAELSRLTATVEELKTTSSIAKEASASFRQELNRIAQKAARFEQAVADLAARTRSQEEEALKRAESVQAELSRLGTALEELNLAAGMNKQAREAFRQDMTRVAQALTHLGQEHGQIYSQITGLMSPANKGLIRARLAASKLACATRRACHLGRRSLELMREGRFWSKVREKLARRRASECGPLGEDFYWSWNPDADRRLSASEHCRRTYLNPDQERISEPSLRARAKRIAAELLPGGPPDAPEVSIIIPVYNNLHFTLTCLESLARHQSRRSFEVLVVDDRSTDSTPAILPSIPGCRHIPTPVNGGFIKACNHGLHLARGKFCVFLNNDTVVLPGWLDELIDTFDVCPDAGIVGSQLLYPDGTLQEAGGLIWRDGSAWNYGRNGLRLRHDFRYRRDVSYVSGASLAIPSDLARKLGGFDEHYCPAYGEDSDLAFRVREAGRRVLYQPFSQLIHFEGMTSGRDLSQGVKAHQVVNAQKLTERWRARMAEFPEPGTSPDAARDCLARRRALVIDACTPMPDQDSGSVTALGLMHGLQALGFKVCFAPQSNMAFIPGYTEALQRDGIEAIYNCDGHAYPYLNDYIHSVGDIFHLVVIFRVGVASACLDQVRRFMPSAKVLFFTSDLHFLREARKAELSGRKADTIKAEITRRDELLVAVKSDCCIVHSAVEQALLARELPSTPVELYGWSIDVVGRGEPFNRRRDFVFLGGYQHPPNVDAVLHFVEDIFPLIKTRIPDAKFYVLGSHPPPELQRLASDDIIITGFVPDLGPCLGKCRVGVAPLRYGAGIKGKIAMMMSHGLPVVTTTMGAEGMNLAHEQEVLIQDDPRAFADEAVRLHGDAALWERLSAAGLEVVDRQYSHKASIQRIKEILQTTNVIQPGPAE